MSVARWAVFEITLRGPSDGNPFLDVQVSADFKRDGQLFQVTGFYDGDGIYRVRFMPDSQGIWHYQTHSNRTELDGRFGSFECTSAGAESHGPVRVHNTFHLAYADGTPYRQIGTTCYAWTHQCGDLQEQTLRSLCASPFNKIRMCVFPKKYAYNGSEPTLYPFEGKAPNQWDFTRFNPKFFQHLEKRIAQLRDAGIEADLILFHPYDEGHWGFDRMDAGTDDRYVRYIVARLAAYRNVWWSLANEFDFMKAKTTADWDRLFGEVQKADPYGHLRSIHNGKKIYDHNKPWVTHASIQNGSAVDDFGRAILYRDVYCKPIVFDEVKYEGNLPQRWGDISAEEMVHRFWQGTIAGTYVGHGETYLDPHDVIWWARGGKLRGKSPARIAFLKHVLDAAPHGLEPIDKWQDVQTVGRAGEYYLVYFGREKPTEWSFALPRDGLAAGMKFAVEILDTWNMTITTVEDTFQIVTDKIYRYSAEGLKKVKLPGNPYMALRIRRLEHDVPPPQPVPETCD
jgi:Domain of unknown function (DUF5060)/Domain of unknown function (DUF5605)/Protein of unknown function (DUF4038)